MKLFYHIRLKAAAYLLKKKSSARKRQAAAVNIEHAGSVGILFNVHDERTYKSVKEYVIRLREEGIRQVKALGFVNQKTIPSYLPYKIYFDYISRSDITWLLIPSSPSTENFLNEHYDILIDLSDDDCFPMKYILAMADARMKVGKQCPEKNAHYDLRMEINEVKTIGYLIDQIDYYIRMINKNKEICETS